MELPQIGAHCYSCHTLDFLPIKCPACEHVRLPSSPLPLPLWFTDYATPFATFQTFCRDHIPLSSHACVSSSTAIAPASTPRPPKSSLEGRCQVESCLSTRMTTWNLLDAPPAAGKGGADQIAFLTTKGDEVVCERCKGAFCLSFVLYLLLPSLSLPPVYPSL